MDNIKDARWYGAHQMYLAFLEFIRGRNYDPDTWDAVEEIMYKLKAVLKELEQ